MVNTTIFATILLFFHQAWAQNSLPRQAKRHPDDQKRLNGLANVPNPALRNADSVYWIRVPTDSGLLHAAIAMPTGKGPFPALLILHGTHGFTEEYVQLARRIARYGVVGIAACWFAGRQGTGVRFITPIDCPDAPPLADVPGADRFRTSRQSIDSLVRKVSTLPHVRTGQLMLFGHSRGPEPL